MNNILTMESYHKKVAFTSKVVLLLRILHASCNKLAEQWMWLVRARFEFRMELNAYMEAILWNFHCFHNHIIR